MVTYFVAVCNLMSDRCNLINVERFCDHPISIHGIARVNANRVGPATDNRQGYRPGTLPNCCYQFPAAHLRHSDVREDSVYPSLEAIVDIQSSFATLRCQNFTPFGLERFDKDFPDRGFVVDHQYADLVCLSALV